VGRVFQAVRCACGGRQGSGRGYDGVGECIEREAGHGVQVLYRMRTRGWRLMGASTSCADYERFSRLDMNPERPVMQSALPSIQCLSLLRQKPKTGCGVRETRRQDGMRWSWNVYREKTKIELCSVVITVARRKVSVRSAPRTVDDNIL
jgi:hypothetical protein